MEISIFQHVKKTDPHLCSLSVRAVRSALQGRREALRERCREGERGGTARTHRTDRPSLTVVALSTRRAILSALEKLFADCHP